MTNKLPVIFALLLILVQATHANAQSVTYRVTFEGKWTTAVTPGGLPSGAHFSPLIGAVHNDRVSFWSSGGTASAGVESMAEIGGTSALRGEIASAGSNAHAVLAKSVPFGGTASATIEFTVTPDHPLVTLVTMVAPSPDWFVGVSGLSLREGGSWLNSRTVNLFPYDAGTENGRGVLAEQPIDLTSRRDHQHQGDGQIHQRADRDINVYASDASPTASASPASPAAASGTRPRPGTGPGAGPGAGTGPGPRPGTGTRPRTGRCRRGPGTPVSPACRRGWLPQPPFSEQCLGAGQPLRAGIAGRGAGRRPIRGTRGADGVGTPVSRSTSMRSAPASALTTVGKSDLSFGSAKLVCVHPAVARMLLVQESGGSPIAMTTLESVRGRQTFYFPVLPRSGRLGLVLTNDNALDAACAVELETADGTSAGGGALTVPAQSTVFRFLDELISAPEDLAGEAVSVACDRAVGSLGMLLNGGVFAAIGPIDPEDRDESQPYRALLPLVMDGGGFQSRLLVTNLSEEVNRCVMRLHGAGMNTARFENAEGVTREDFGRATLELAADGGRISLSSFGRHTLAFGHVALDCDAPADARNLLTSLMPEGPAPAGMAVVAPAQFAREVRFPVAPRLGRLALVLSNNAESDASCEAALAMPGREETVSATTAIRVAGASTAVRFLADLFELPDDFMGGEARLLCDREIAAVSLPFAGAAFAAMPPTVPGFSAAAPE